MAQYFTDFSEYTVDAAPDDWTARWGNDAAIVRDSDIPGGSGHSHALELSGTEAMSWDAVGEPSGDIEITTLFYATSLLATQDTRARFWLHGSEGAADELNGYSFGLASAGGWLRRWVDQSSTIVDSDTGSPGAGVWAWIRIQREDNNLRARAWLLGDPEPETWNWSGTDSTFESGFVSVMRSNATGTLWVAAFGVGTDGDSAPLSKLEPYVHSWTVTSSGTSQVSTRTLNVPDHEPGDLLVTVIGAVSGTGSYSYMTHPDWNEHLTHDGTAPSSILWRIASENEPVSYTFEDVNSQTGRRASAMVCIKNADKRIPFTDAEIKSSGGDEWNFPDMRAIAPNSLILALTHNHGLIMTAPNEFTSFYSDNPSGVRSHGFYKEASAVGPLGPYTFTRDGATADGGVALMVIQPPTDQYIFDFEKDAVDEQPSYTTSRWHTQAEDIWRVRDRGNPWGERLLEFSRASSSATNFRLLSIDGLPLTENVQLLSAMRLSTVSGTAQRAGLVTRGSGSGGADQTGYVITTAGPHSRMMRLVDGNQTNFGSTANNFIFAEDQWRMVRIEIQGDQFSSKVWNPADLSDPLASEPTEWDATVTTSHIPDAGMVGMFIESSNVVAEWAFIGVGVDGASAPLPLIELVVEPPSTPDNLTATLTAWDTVHLTADPGTES